MTASAFVCSFEDGEPRPVPNSRLRAHAGYGTAGVPTALTGAGFVVANLHVAVTTERHS